MDYLNIAFLLLLIGGAVLFVFSSLRYDLVAVLLLLGSAILGVVPDGKVFSGFGHPAFITLASIFIITRAIENTGFISRLEYHLRVRKKIIWRQVFLICGAVMLLSALINNVAAVALFLPVTLRISKINNIPRSYLLMPLSFCSLLGGLTTLIGTPPNIIVSDYRSHIGLSSFSFFDFTLVGLPVAIIGFCFIVFLGWRLLRMQKNNNKEKSFLHNELFTSELVVSSRSSLVGKRLSHLLNEYSDKVTLLALIRDGSIVTENVGLYIAKNQDSLVIKTDKSTLRLLIDQYNLDFSTQKTRFKKKYHYVIDSVIMPESQFVGRSIQEINSEKFKNLDIIALSRRGMTITEKIEKITLQVGDVLLFVGENEITQDEIDQYDLLLIGETQVRTFSLLLLTKVSLIFGVAIIATMSHLLKVDIAFFSAAMLMILTNCIRLDTAYRSIQWPILFLVAALIPIGNAMITSGFATFIAKFLYFHGQNYPLWISLLSLIVICILSATVFNTAIVALLFSPVAIQLAAQWMASPDPFLMAVAIGASCSFITPIGHQSNMLILGPGNYRFGDFWRMGLPLTFIVSIVATFLIALIWPAYT